jgi:hypothetical protein
MNKVKLIHKAKGILSDYISQPPSEIRINQYVGFRAIGLAHIDWAAAANEIRALFLGQWKNGMLPNLVFGKKNEANHFVRDFWEVEGSQYSPDEMYTSGVTQLPIYGVVLLKMYELAENKEEAAFFLQEMYPKIYAFHKYLYSFRDKEEEGLIAVIHPYESGTEGSPLWDSVLDRIEIEEGNQKKKIQGEESRDYDYERYLELISLFQKNKFEASKIEENCPVQVQDPFFNATLSWSNEAMIEIGRIIKEDVTDFVLWNELTVFSMNEKLWDEEEGIYNAYDMVNKVFIPGNTLSGMLPIMADVPNIDQAENILRNVKDDFFSGTTENPMYLCPTYDVTAENISLGKKQRGAVSIYQNWLLFQGLKRFEMNAVAQKLKRDSLELTFLYGFCESFNPVKQSPIASNSNVDFSGDISCVAICLDFLLDE